MNNKKISPNNKKIPPKNTEISPKDKKISPKQNFLKWEILGRNILAAIHLLVVLYLVRTHLYHLPAVARLAVNLLESQRLHEHRNILVRHRLAEGGVRADALHHVTRRNKLAELGRRIGIRNTVELVDALGYVVVHSEIKIVALNLLVLLLRKPVNPVARLTPPALLYHLLSQCYSLGVDALVIEGEVDGTLDLLDAPDEETAVLVIIDDMNLIARGTEPRIVLQNAVPLGIRDSQLMLRFVMLLLKESRFLPRRQLNSSRHTIALLAHICRKSLFL